MMTEEKLSKAVKLADAMYNRMQNLTTDTSGIRKAMDEYHQFIINEYYKEDTEKDFGIKESVIPFGASDSELMEATYFIPQGYYAVIEGNKVIIKKGEKPISNDLEEAAHFYVDTTIEWFDSEGNPCCYPAFIAGAQWQKENLWKNAQGDDLPEIDREVVVLVKVLPEHEDSLLRLSFAHRPPEYWEGKSANTGKITRYEPMRYDKGQWNMPAVVWWLDVELPKKEE